MYRYILIGLLLGGIAFAQPRATVQFFGGYSLPLGDLRGNFGDTTITPYNSDSLTYLMSYGINYGITYKRPVFMKSGNFNLIASLLFNAFGRSKDFNNVTVKLKQNIISLCVGAEWQFSPKRGVVNPFIDFEFMGNVFNGSLTQEFSSTTYTITMRSAFRLGVITGGGIDFALHQNVGLIIGAKYSYANLVGRGYVKDTDKNYGLNDKEYTIGNALYPARNIEFIQFYGGVSFYFGK